MSKRMKLGVLARGLVAAVGLASASVSSWAWLQVDVDGVDGFGAIEAVLFANSFKWTLDVQGPALSWNCATSEDCSFTGKLTTSVLIKPVDGKLVPSDTLSLGGAGLRLGVVGGFYNDQPQAPVALIDPYGHNHGYYQVDVGKWTFSASGSISVPNGPMFMTAYGDNTVSLTDETGAAYGGQRQLIGSSDTHLSTTYGPGAAGASALPDDFKEFKLKQDLITPYFAYPSTTNPRCKELSCLDYAAGIYTPDAYVFTFSLVSVPAPAVPEPSAALMALAGLGAVVYAARRRKA